MAEILEGLLAKRGKQPLGRYDLIEHAPAVIAAALDSGDPGTIQTGQRIMDALGRSGHIRIAELVQTAVKEGESLDGADLLNSGGEGA